MIHIHVDIDNIWIYEKEYGVSFSKDPEFLFNTSLPCMLDIFARHAIKATFFVVGKDLEMQGARKFCNKAIKAGHALGNHTYTHPVNFSTLSFQEKQREIQGCHNAILSATNQKPLGFRAPGYYIDQEIIHILSGLGYKYDSSVLPGYANYLMRIYIKYTGRISKEKAFGRNCYLFASRKPCIIKNTPKQPSLYEFPISVLPFLRCPAHSTFLFLMGRTYFNLMKLLYKISPKNHTYLFHAIDFVDIPNADRLARCIIPFRWLFQKRTDFIEEILFFLQRLSSENIKTTESRLDAFSMALPSKSFLLSHWLKPYLRK